MTAGRSLTARLVAAALVWLALLLAAGGVILSAAFRDALEREFGHRLEATLRALIAATEIAPDGSVAVVRPLGDPRFEQVYSGWYWQASEPSGRLIRSRSLWDERLPVHAARRDGQKHRLAGPKGEPLLGLERDLQFPEAAGVVHVQVAGSLAEVMDAARRFDLLLAGALVLFGVGMAVAVAIQVRFGLRPLRRMRAGLDAIRRGERARLGGPYPSEVAPLAEAMNAVLDRDEDLIERARTHAGNLAHALKTPLAILNAEMHGEPDRTVVAEQVKAMSRLIDYHLARAAAMAGAGRLAGTAAPVAEVARALASTLARIHAERHVAIAVDVPDADTFPGQRDDLEEMLGNLMDNACKWAAGRVRITTARPPEALEISVEDDGPGLSPAEAESATRRGIRLDEMAPGFGLGLSVVADIAAINGGSVVLSRSDLGGLKATLSFPLPQSQEITSCP